jgi:hypothetical protein
MKEEVAIKAEMEKLRKENEALKSASKGTAKEAGDIPSQPVVSGPAMKPKAEPKIEAAKKSKTASKSKPFGRSNITGSNKPNGTGPQPHI